MDAGTITTIAVAVATGLGGGGTVVSKLTRIAVAVEGLVDSQKKVTEKVAEHEIRLAKGGL